MFSNTTTTVALPQSITDERKAVASAWSDWLKKILPSQRADRSDQDGGFEMVVGSGWCDGRESAYVLGKLLAGRCWVGELDCDGQALESAIERVIPFILGRQHPSGELDLGGGHSPNEAGFPLPPIVEGYTRLRDEAPEFFNRIEPGLKTFLLRAADAVVDGEAYTANHRWTAAGAPLAAVYSLWPDPRYLAKIQSYLADGIDCDPQGVWYEERSPNYNVVANNGLLVISRYLNKPELLEHVVRSLEFAMYATHPNGEADTSFSHRQDRGNFNFPAFSYAQARRVALLTGDGRFTTMARGAMQPHRLIGDGLLLPFQLDLFPGPLPEPLPLPDHFDVDFPSLHVSRYRAGHTSLTIAADPGGHFYDTVRDTWGGVRRSDDWFHLHHHDVVIQTLHVAASPGSNIQPAQVDRLGPRHWKLSGKDPGWVHTLHFRPGSPRIQMHTGQTHSIDVQIAGAEVSVGVQCKSDKMLVGALNLWVRPGVKIREGDGPESAVTAGSIFNLKGNLPVMITGEKGSITIRGIPASAHYLSIAPQPAIPSALHSNCGRLTVGLRLPIALKLQMTLN